MHRECPQGLGRDDASGFRGHGLSVLGCLLMLPAPLCTCAAVGTQAHFQELERTVYHSLFTLIKDTTVLRDDTATAMQILQVSQ